MIIKMKRSLLALSITLASSSLYALEIMSDENLSDVSGQEGLQLISTVSSIDMNRVYWQDDSNPASGTALDLRWDTVNIAPTTGTAFSTTQLDFGASAGGVPAIYMSSVTQPFRMKNKGIRVSDATTASSNTFGLFAMETTTNSTFTYFNTNGLFDATSSNGKFTFDVQGANLYLAQPRCFYVSCALSSSTTTTGVSIGSGAFAPNGTLTQNYNVLAFKDLNFKGSMAGKFSLDATKGLNFNGTLSLPRINASTNGFQLKVGVQSNVNFGSPTPDFNFASVASIKPYWQFGFSGNLRNADFSIKGDNTTALSSANTAGIKISAQADFAKSTDADPFVLEMGEPFGLAGASPFTVQFKNWVALSDGAAVAPAAAATFKFGDAYINLLAPNTSMANFTLNADQTNDTITPNPFVGVSFGAITTPNIANENSFSQALRGYELQAYARTIAFNDGTTVTPQTWALMPLFYGFNSNLVLYPSGHPNLGATLERRGIGFDWNIETLGMANSDGSACTTVVCAKGTHLLIADTGTNQYAGFRNINARYSFLNGQLYAADATTDGVEGLMLRIKNFALDFNGEFAVGDLPNGTTVTGIRNDDEFFGIRLRLGGDLKLAFSPAPTNESYIGLSGSLNMTNGALNSLTFTEPVDGTQLQFANITGLINLRTENVDFATDSSYEDASRIDLGIATSGPFSGKSFVTFAGALEFAPGTGNADVVRIKDINFIQGSTYRLGEAVLTGGRFYGQVDIRPQ